jgi:hypothetical protein
MVGQESATELTQSTRSPSMGPPTRSFLLISLPVKILGGVFRGQVLAGLKRLHRRSQPGCAGPAAALADPQQFAKLLRRLTLPTLAARR